MVCRARICLKDLYGQRGLTNDQEGENHSQKGIRGSGTERRQLNLCSVYNSSSGSNNYPDSCFLLGLSCLINERENKNSY